MSAYATLPKLSGCAALVVLAYAWWGGVTSEPDRPLTPAEPSSVVRQDASLSRANALPWLSPEVGRADLSSAIEQSSSVDDLLWAYQQGGSDPESKRQIRNRLNVLKQDSTARNRMIECFVGRHGPSLAQAMYGLMRDADFKDEGLIESIIQRLPAQADASVKNRVVDLIADSLTMEAGGYSTVIDGYLFQQTHSDDMALRQAATAQRIWYVAQRQPDRLTALLGLIRDPMPAVRDEMYGALETQFRGAITSQMRQTYVPALTDLLTAPDVVMPELERNRISELLAALNRP